MVSCSLHAIKVAFTDWSGVISYDLLVVYEANKRMLQRRERPVPSFEEWLALSQASVHDMLVHMGCPPEDRASVSLEYAAHLRDLASQGMRPTVYPTALGFAQRCAKMNVPLIVVSTHPQANIATEARRYGLSPYIEAIFGGVRDKAEVIRECVQSMDNPANAWFFGDMTFDIQAAKAAGVRSVGVATGYHSRARLQAEMPDLLVDSLEELTAQLLAA